MQTAEFPSVADRKLHRLVDVTASNEAAAALHAAAVSAPHDAVLVAADAVASGDPYDGARDRLRDSVASREFAPIVRGWMREMRQVASAWPDSGACTLATALRLWSWTLEHFRATDGPAVDELAGVMYPLIAARCLVIHAVTDKSDLKIDLSHVYAAHASAQAGATCAELVFGYRRHLVWDAQGCATCYVADDLDELEAFIPGIASGARSTPDVIEADGSHPAKRGPCAPFDGLETFMKMRNRLDACLTGARIIKNRAAAALARRP